MNKNALAYKGGLWIMNNIVNINQAATQAAATPATSQVVRAEGPHPIASGNVPKTYTPAPHKPYVAPAPYVKPDPFDTMPKELCFEIGFQETLVASKKYVVDTTACNTLDVVRSSYTPVSHKAFFDPVVAAIKKQFTVANLSDAKVEWGTAKDCCFAIVDVKLPSISRVIMSKKKQIELCQRVVAAHSIDDSCPDLFMLGAVDTRSQHKQYAIQHSKVWQRHKNFAAEHVTDQLKVAELEFDAHCNTIQGWVLHDITAFTAKTVIENTVQTSKFSERLYAQYLREANAIGHNVYALYRTFTAYASLPTALNGFEVKALGKLNAAAIMFQRELKVMEWVSGQPFVELTQ